jgi:peptide/nickel transport system permease protein/oligopeptide transport system permease protein
MSDKKKQEAREEQAEAGQQGAPSAQPEMDFDQEVAAAADGVVAAGEDPTKTAEKSRTLWSDAWVRLKRNKLAIIAAIWITFMVIVAVTADLWVPQTLGSPIEVDTTQMGELARQPPSAEHPFGTDQLGRDVLCRVIYGARISLSVGLLATAISTVIGLVMGAIAAYYGGIWDSIIMRLADIFLAFPYTLFVIMMLAVMGGGIQNVFIAIGILGWPQIARVFRSAILTIKENDYVDAARAMGASDARIIARHILPNSVATVVVYATMNIGGAILTESALSYLGMGVTPPQPSWGSMISEGQTYLASSPWLMIMPGLAILTTVLAFTLLGDGLRDALDVKMKDA